MKGQLSRIQDWEALAREAKYDPSTIAALCRVSLRQLERFFLEKFKRTPRQWIRELRAGLAMQYVRQGWSSKAIAVELNFPSLSAFCHQFKTVFKSPPQAFAPTFTQKNKPKPPKRKP